MVFSYYSYTYFFLILPFFSFFLLFLQFLILPFYNIFIYYEYSFLFFLVLIGLFVYFRILIGFFRKSKYGIYGGIRRRSQSISFEVVFFFLFFVFPLLRQSFNLINNFNFFFSIYNFFIFFLLLLIELNRAPFDFSEGESELVRGYNLEFSGIFFILIFVGEYGFLIFFSLFFSYFIFNNFFFIRLIIFFFFLFIRSCFPRYRYDKLISFSWLILLPISMFIFFFNFLVLWVFNSFHYNLVKKFLF